MSDERDDLVNEIDDSADPQTMRELLKQERDRIQLLQQIAAAANEAESMGEAFQIALDLVCEYSEWPLAHVFMPSDTEGGDVVLASSGIWHCDDCEENETFTFFQEVTEKTEIVSGEGWLGRVLAQGEPAWSVNVREEPDFQRNKELEEWNARTGFAFPVLSGDEVVAIMEFYATETMQPDQELLEIMGNIGTQLGRVVERERSAKEIIRSRDHYKKVLQDFPFLIWQTGKTGDCTYFNQTWLDFTGRELEQELGDGWLENVHPDDRDDCRETFQTSVSQRLPFNLECRLQRYDGVYRWVRDHGRPFYDLDEDYAGYIGACTDITDQIETMSKLKKREMMLESSRAFLADAQRLAQMGNWEYDLDTGKITASEQLYRLYGLDPRKNELTRQLMFEMEHPDDRDGSEQRLQRVLEKKEPYTANFRMIRWDGKVLHIEAYTEPVLDASGQVYKLRGTVQDVSERKKAEVQIKQHAEQLAVLSKMGQTVVSTLDLETVLDHVLETLRPLLNAEGVFVLLKEGEDQLRFAAADYIGEGNLRDVVVSIDHGVASEAISSGMPQQVSGDEARERVFKQIEQISAYTTHSIIAVPLKWRRQTIGVLEAVHTQPNAFADEDLTMLSAASPWIAIAIENARLYGEVETRRRRYRDLAEELVWSQEDERRRISRDLHDDIGQGVIALEIQLELLQQKIENEALRQEIEKLKELSGNITQRLRSLAYNLRPPELETVGLYDTLAELCQEYENQAGFSVTFAGERLPQQVPEAIVLSFYRFLQEAMTNIVRHAEASQVAVRFSYDGDTIRLSVSDNGQGFDPAASRAEQASGLGLLGMQERFTSLNGMIEIDSTIGEGTTLTAHVPW